jgi:DNA polymerase I-like protein with 3'-5' exonuclease and polymerase domains
MNLYLTDLPTAQKAVEKLSQEPVLGVDIETTGLDPHTSETRLVSVAASDGITAVFDLRRVPIETLLPLTQRPWITFNGSFEYRHLTRAGLPVPLCHDVQLLDRLASHQMHRPLAAVSKDWLGIELDKSEQKSDWAANALSREQIDYAAQDALITLRLAGKLLPKIEQAGQRPLYRNWCHALPVLAQLQLTGQSFDWDKHQQLIEAWQQEHETLYCQIREQLGDINPNSGPQLGEWLKGNLESRLLKRWPKTATGRFKTDADTLALFANLPVIQPLLRYKAVGKLLSTYGKSYAQKKHPTTENLHPDFQLGQTRSGRICASGPNTQNPPRLACFRELFIPAPGKVFIGADYSQIELRVAALLSQDTVMLNAYRKGRDLHTLTAAAVAGVAEGAVTKAQRTAAKAINFGNLYGQGPAGLARTAKLDYGAEMTTQEAEAALNAFHTQYYRLSAWKRQQMGMARQFRKVHTRLGLIRDFDAQGEGYLNGEACNIPIQGSAAEVLICTLKRLPAALKGLDARLYHNIHDELILESSTGDADKAADKLKQTMIEGFLEVFPEAGDMVGDLVDVQRGESWAGVH